MVDRTVIRDLGSGLVLRRAVAADAEALNRVFGELKDNPEAVTRVFGE